MVEKYDNKKELSTSALAKELHVTTQSLFEKLAEMGLLSRVSNNWELTPAGKIKGGHIRKSKNFGRYLTWPETLKFELQEIHNNVKTSLLTATSIGKHFEISANRTNSILSELGWIKKGIKGWLVTESGERVGGLQSKDKTSGIPYVRWPESIMDNRIFVSSIREVKGEIAAVSQDQAKNTDENEVEFRDKFKPTLRATDGHYVRSKAELLIDNWLYMSELVHAYERKLPVEEEIYSDFYIPKGKVYIEYWGYGDDSKYSIRKQAKLEIYRKYNFHLIELTDKDVQNLDDILPQLLLAFGISTE